MKLILIRHGQTLLNAQGITMGQLDSPLTAAGVAQARQKGELLSGSKISTVYSSDLGRCKKTAEEIHKYLPDNPPIIFLEGLREIDFGIYQGRPYSDVPIIDKGYITRPFPGGESNEVMAQRVVGAVNEIYEAHKDKTVLIVTHSGPISAIMAAYSRVALADMLEQKTDNTEIIELALKQRLVLP